MKLEKIQLLRYTYLKSISRTRTSYTCISSCTNTSSTSSLLPNRLAHRTTATGLGPLTKARAAPSGPSSLQMVQEISIPGSVFVDFLVGTRCCCFLVTLLVLLGVSDGQNGFVDCCCKLQEGCCMAEEETCSTCSSSFVSILDAIRRRSTVAGTTSSNIFFAVLSCRRIGDEFTCVCRFNREMEKFPVFSSRMTRPPIACKSCCGREEMSSNAVATHSWHCEQPEEDGCCCRGVAVSVVPLCWLASIVFHCLCSRL